MYIVHVHIYNVDVYNNIHVCTHNNIYSMQWQNVYLYVHTHTHTYTQAYALAGTYVYHIHISHIVVHIHVHVYILSIEILCYSTGVETPCLALYCVVYVIWALAI